MGPAGLAPPCATLGPMGFLLSSCLLAAFWVAVWYVGVWVTVKLSPAWPRSVVEGENGPHWGACTFMSTVNALVTSAICVPSVIVMLDRSREAWFYPPRNFDTCFDDQGGITCALLAFIGQSFTIRTAIDLVLQFVHGLLTAEEATHHVIFITAGLLIRGHCMMPLNAGILMSMEASTPFLNYYLYFRSRYPYSNGVNLAKMIFGVLFLLFRMLLNTLGALLFLRQYLGGPSPAMPGSVPVWQQLLMVFMIVAGALLQMMWGTKIVLGFLKPSKKAPARLKQPLAQQSVNPLKQ